MFDASISMGPFALPIRYLAAFAAVLLAGLVISVILRRRPLIRRHVLDAATNAAIAFIVAWKLAPLVVDPAAVIHNPVTLLYVPGGSVGAVFGFIVAAGVVIVSLRRRHRNISVIGLPILAIAALSIIFYGLTGAGFSIASNINGANVEFRYDRSVLETTVPVLPPTRGDTSRTSLQATLAEADGRPLVLNFWATWCGPCRAENPIKKAAYERWSGDALFIGVNLTTSEGGRGAVTDYIREHELPYPVYLDTQASLQYAFGVRGTPTTLVLDAEEKLVDRRYGPMTRGWIDRALRNALGGALPE